MSTYESLSSLKGETALKKEQELFGELFARLRDAVLNRMFDLRPERAMRRRIYLIVLLLISGFLIALSHPNYSLGLWTGHLREIFQYSFNPTYAAGFPGNPYSNFAIFVWRAFTDPYTMQYLPVLLAPFFIALQSAALYLADVFELEDIRVARKFVSEVALSGSDETIRISQGEITEESRLSPNYLIGGPGKVVVDLDSAVLFEKPDGTPRVIGPTAKEPGSMATLEGFERFRQAIDLRDHFIELRDQNEKSPSVMGRSLDGIPVVATDVRLMFSVYRNGKTPTPLSPYPFSPRAIEQLVYNSTSRVTPDQPNPSSYEFSWINNMIGLVRGELGKFMSQRNLTEYLASIGKPELERARAQEVDIAEQARQHTVPAEEAPQLREVNPAPEFTPRSQVTSLFSQFTEKFSGSARQRGVELHWIGVGTWRTPIESIPEKHLEAWKLSHENLARGSEGAMKKHEKEAILQRTVALIQDVPVGVYHKLKDNDQDRTKAMRSLLLAYQQQLHEAAESMRSRGEAVPPHIEDALRHINSLFGHVI